MENGIWYGDSPRNPGVYNCGCCRGTGVVRVNLQARYCVQCKGRGSATAAEIGIESCKESDKRFAA